jgi:hypothetical protein
MVATSCPRRMSIVSKAAISVGVVAVCLVACVAIVIVRDVHRRVIDAPEAARTFADVRARLGDARPLLDIDAQLQLIVHRDRNAPRQSITALHSLSYNPRTGRCVRADLPMWLLRLATVNGRVRLVSIDRIQKNGERVTLEDLERHGPGLLLSVDLRDYRLLVWTD